MCSLSICMSFSSNSEIRSSEPSHWKPTTLGFACCSQGRPGFRGTQRSAGRQAASESTWCRILSESLGLVIFRIFVKESTFIPKDASPGGATLRTGRALLTVLQPRFWALALKLCEGRLLEIQGHQSHVGAVHGLNLALAVCQNWSRRLHAAFYKNCYPAVLS